MFDWTLFQYVLTISNGSFLSLLSFLSIACGITAVVVYCIAVKEWYNEVYIKYHSMWHCFVFLTGGFVSLLRYNLDEQLYPISRRGHLDSI